MSPEKKKYPMGHIMRVIGIKGEVKVESEVILLEHNVEIKPFSQQVLDCLPKNDYSISEASERYWYRL